jgi:hypothetical protein
VNRKILSSLFGVILLMGLAACSSNNSTPPPTEAITVGSGSGQTTPVSTAFNAPLVANVSTGSTPNSGVSVTFTAPSSGAGGNFGSGATTATVTTDANGNATSPAFTANGTAGTYNVVATAQGVSGSATFALTNTSSTLTVTTYSFYAAGTDADDFNYTLAGSVSIDSNGNVTSGVQDFNDGGGAVNGVTSPEPSGDSITGGTLSVTSGTQQGTLTLVTNNALLGTETLAVNFANTNHALIAEFDGNATSVGSLDLQTSISTMPSGAFSFAGAGADVNGNQVVAGGIFTITNTGLSGTIDVDDDFAPQSGTAFSATVGSPNSTTGRGTLTNSAFGISVVYYVVGPEAIRIMDVDTTDTFLASAYGQGAGNFTASSIGQSVISVTGTPVFVQYVLAGQISTTPNAETFAGVIDADEYGSFANANPISGTYAMASDGYGSLTITNGGGGDATSFGVYAVDPNLNISDPNNSTGGGGALVVDLDTAVVGTGVLVPQTDIVAADFSGSYVFDGQFITTNDEADFAGQGTVTGTAFAGTGFLNDPFGDFVTTPLNSSVTFAGALQADGSNPGRYFLDPLEMTVPNVTGTALTVAVYQASGGQLFWVETDAGSVFSGQIQQQASASSGAKKPPLKAASRKH